VAHVDEILRVRGRVPSSGRRVRGRVPLDPGRGAPADASCGRARWTPAGASPGRP